ncbi:hypothetical protein [Cupriavidus basilensis]|uniref:hypothetical protein n=1 Tax=Cupriavidus basilensis TaxID=68895 RepID=UPI000750D917|nr:hypothetical protein [Cupriavidus basilensis]
MGIIESVQQYDLNIPAGGAQNIDVAGDRVQFLSATDPFAQIEIRPNYAQGNISLKPGQGFKFSEQVTRWVVFNRSNLPLSGYLLIGSGDFFDQRIAGTVDVIDGGKARTMGGVAMMGYGYGVATVGQFSHIQLWNPAGSGKNLFVEQLSFFSTGTVANGVGVKPSSTPLVNFYSNPQSKRLNAQASTAEIRNQANAAFLGGIFMGVLDKVNRLMRPAEPIMVSPGAGLMVIGSVPNEDLGAAFEFFEEAA